MEDRSMGSNSMSGRGLVSPWHGRSPWFEGISVRDYLTLKDREADTSRYLEMVGLAPELYLNRNRRG